jgi:hypothetical protein
MAEQDDVTTCGICFEPFKHGDIAVQAARWGGASFMPIVPKGAPKEIIDRLNVATVQALLVYEKFDYEKFWAHPVCLFSIAREAEGPASRVAAMPPEPPDDGGEALPEKRKPK